MKREAPPTELRASYIIRGVDLQSVARPLVKLDESLLRTVQGVVLCRALKLAIVIKDGKVDHPVVVNEGTRQLCLKERFERSRYIMLDIPPTYGTAL